MAKTTIMPEVSSAMPLSNARIEYNIAKAQAFDMDDKDLMAQLADEVRVATQGLTLNKGDEFTVLQVVRIPVINKIAPDQKWADPKATGPFTPVEKGVWYAFLGFSKTKVVRARLSDIINAPSVTGIEDESKRKLVQKCIDDEDTIKFTGNLIADITAINSVKLECIHSILGVEKEVNAKNGTKQVLTTNIYGFK